MDSKVIVFRTDSGLKFGKIQEEADEVVIEYKQLSLEQTSKIISNF